MKKRTSHSPFVDIVYQSMILLSIIRLNTKAYTGIAHLIGENIANPKDPCRERVWKPFYRVCCHFSRAACSKVAFGARYRSRLKHTNTHTHTYRESAYERAGTRDRVEGQLTATCQTYNFRILLALLSDFHDFSNSPLKIDLKLRYWRVINVLDSERYLRCVDLNSFHLFCLPLILKRRRANDGRIDER